MLSYSRGCLRLAVSWVYAGGEEVLRVPKNWIPGGQSQGICAGLLKVFLGGKWFQSTAAGFLWAESVPTCMACARRKVDVDTLFRPCVDCGLKTGCFCDGKFGPGFPLRGQLPLLQRRCPRRPWTAQWTRRTLSRLVGAAKTSETTVPAWSLQCTKSMSGT